MTNNVILCCSKRDLKLYLKEESYIYNIINVYDSNNIPEIELPYTCHKYNYDIISFIISINIEDIIKLIIDLRRIEVDISLFNYILEYVILLSSCRYSIILRINKYIEYCIKNYNIRYNKLRNDIIEIINE